MKAKEVAKRYNSELENRGKVVAEYINFLSCQFGILQKQRNAKTNSALLSIIHELHNRWSGFVNRTNGNLKKAGFLGYLKSKSDLVDHYFEMYPDIDLQREVILVAVSFVNKRENQ